MVYLSIYSINMNIIIDFSQFERIEDMYEYLYKKLKFDLIFDSEVWRSADDFFDMYSHSKDNVFFEIRNFQNIQGQEYIRRSKAFISSLEGLKWYQDGDKRIVPNPNFDYEIIS